MLTSLSKLFRPAPDVFYGIEVTADGAKVMKKEGNDQSIVLQFAWDDVLKVTAYKRDLFTVDRICFELAYADGKFSEVNEDMQGWSEFVEAMETKLVGALKHDEWFSKVALPAFATNITLIF